MNRIKAEVWAGNECEFTVRGTLLCLNPLNLSGLIHTLIKLGVVVFPFFLLQEDHREYTGPHALFYIVNLFFLVETSKQTALHFLLDSKIVFLPEGSASNQFNVLTPVLSTNCTLPSNFRKAKTTKVTLVFFYSNNVYKTHLDTYDLIIWSYSE